MKPRFSSVRTTAIGTVCALLIAGLPAVAGAEDTVPSTQATPESAVPKLNKPAVVETQPVLVNVANVEVKGNATIPAQEILKATDVKTGDQVDSEKLQDRLQENLKRILALGTIADANANVVQFRNGIVITYTVQENPRIAGVTVTGNTLIETGAINAVISSKAGQTADRNLIQKDMEAISKLYQDKGYAVNDVKVNMDDKQGLSYAIIETFIGKVTITGNSKTKEYVIRRELLSKEGRPYNRNEIQTELRRVLNLGFFEAVTPKFTPSDKPEAMDYTIEVKEQRTGRFGGGVTYSVTDGIVGNVTIEEPNLFGRAQGVKINFEAGLKGSKTYEASYFEPRLGGSRTTLNTHLFSKDTKQTDYDAAPVEGKRPGYTERRTGGDVQFGLALAEDDRLNVGIGSEYTSNTKDDGTAYNPSEAYRGGRTNFADIGYTRDTRDNYLDPKSGYRIGANARLATDMLGGDNGFAKLTGSFSTYKKLFGEHVLAVRVSGGQALHKAGDVLPAQEKFRLGGSESIRGFDYGAIAGDAMYYGNAELRLAAQNRGYLVLFSDLGNAWDMGSGNLQAPKISAGIGARVNTPIGPLRLDYGWRKAEPDSGKSVEGKFHFSFGQTF